MVFGSAHNKSHLNASVLLVTLSESLLHRASDRDDQIDVFWRGADFGYIKERRNELTVLCEPYSSVSYQSIFLYFVSIFSVLYMDTN
jgi:hypothetical protein